MFTDLATFDLLFVLSAVAFNLLIAAIFVAQTGYFDKIKPTINHFSLISINFSV